MTTRQISTINSFRIGSINKGPRATITMRSTAQQARYATTNQTMAFSCMAMASHVFDPVHAFVQTTDRSVVDPGDDPQQHRRDHVADHADGDQRLDGPGFNHGVRYGACAASRSPAGSWCAPSPARWTMAVARRRTGLWWPRACRCRPS